MKLIFVIVAMVLAIRASAVVSEPATPRSFTLTFITNPLPQGAKVAAVDLQLDRTEAIRVRSLPAGWVTSTFRPRDFQFEVAIGLESWGRDRGSPVNIADLNEKFWIVPVLEDEKPLEPRHIRVVISYVLPSEAVKGPLLIQSLEAPASSIRLTYIP